MSALRLRLASAAALLAMLLAALAAGPVVALPFMTVMIMVGTWEYYNITRGMGAPAAPWVLFPLTLALLFRFQLNAISPTIVALAITLSVGIGLAGLPRATRPAD